MVFWSFGTHDSYSELVLHLLVERKIIKKILYMLIYGRNHHNIVFTFQFKKKLKKFVDGIL